MIIELKEKILELLKNESEGKTFGYILTEVNKGDRTYTGDQFLFVIGRMEKEELIIRDKESDVIRLRDI